MTHKKVSTFIHQNLLKRIRNCVDSIRPKLVKPKNFDLENLMALNIEQHSTNRNVRTVRRIDVSMQWPNFVFDRMPAENENHGKNELKNKSKNKRDFGTRNLHCNLHRPIAYYSCNSCVCNESGEEPSVVVKNKTRHDKFVLIN